MGIKMMITGATGMVGEGVLLECLQNPEVTEVLLVNRKPYTGPEHFKLKQLIVSDFMKLDAYRNQLNGYDACFFCAGVSSVGMNEADYTKITYHLTLYFAETLAALNPEMVFIYVSGTHTDSSEKGKLMWARVKGKTENALMRLPFKKVYNFRPGFMKATEGQKNIKGIYKVFIALYPVLRLIFRGGKLDMSEVGQAMINGVVKGYPKSILEIEDIRALAHQ